MVVKLGTSCCLHLSNSPAFGTFYSPLLSPLSPNRSRCRPAGALVLSDRTAFLGSGATRLFRSRSVDDDTQLIRRSTSLSSLASDQGFFHDDSDDDDEDEFVEKLRELAARVEEENRRLGVRAEEEVEEDVSGEIIAAAFSSPGGLSNNYHPSSPAVDFPKSPESMVDVAPPKWVAVPRSLPDWRTVGGGVMVNTISSSSSISELSTTISRNKAAHQQQHSQSQRWDDGGVTTTAEESTSACSVKRALSSLVFIIRELHSHTLQLREMLFCEELQLDGLLAKVSAEVHASFCWLFQQIFSCTPTLMVSVMLLMANFTVYSMAAGGIGPAAAATAFPSLSLQPPIVSAEYRFDVQDIVDQIKQPQQEEEETEQMVRRRISGSSGSSTTFTFCKSSPSATPIGGDDGGGRPSRPVAGATDDSHNNPNTNEGDHSGRYLAEEEARAWRRIQDEASKLVAETRHESLTDPDTLRHLVAPISVPCYSADSAVSEYMRTELEYRMAVEASPENPLLLANYAQFLFLVARDHDRAEHYFKRAAAVSPRDAESLVRYADFLWLARNDICTAEETYLEAMEADPGNACYAASYAHFLWNTGGEDTCFPLGDQYCQDQEEMEDDEHDAYHDERSSSSA